MTTVHVVPIMDRIEHDTDDEEECVCGPTSQPAPRSDGSMGWVVVHHSLDGRERREAPADRDTTPPGG